jgi:hypothetical protein
MEFDSERVWLNVRKAETQDLINRVTVYRQGMEEDALSIIERELHNRGITQEELEQNVPNPFNPSTRIVYVVPTGGEVRVTLDVFDVNGRRIRRLASERPSTGRVAIEWDGRDDAGRAMASGVYFYRLVAGATTITRRMTLLK